MEAKTCKSEMEFPHSSHQHLHGTCSQPQFPCLLPVLPKHSQDITLSQFSTSFPAPDKEEPESLLELDFSEDKGLPSPVSVSSTINGIFLRSEDGDCAVSVLDRSIVGIEEVRPKPVKPEIRIENRRKDATIFLIGLLVVGVLCAYFSRKLLRAVS